MTMAPGRQPFPQHGSYFFDTRTMRQLQYEVSMEDLNPELLKRGALFGEVKFYGWRILLKRFPHNTPL